MKKIVIIGPESTGKSTLSSELAKHYGALWVPEYARSYLLQHGNTYNYEDLLTIAKGQLTLELQFTERSENNTDSKLLFLDTDMYVMKVWSEFVFGKCHQWILEQVVKRKYDLYLLCNTDLPWVKEELREYPDIGSRLKLYHMYKDIMVNQSVPWVDIKGIDETRFQIAVNAVNQL